MDVPSFGPRHPDRGRPWGLITVLAGFFVAAVCVLAVGVLSLELNPLLR